MEFLDEDARPRFRPLSSTPQALHSSDDDDELNNKLSKPFLALTLSLSSLFIVLSLFFLHSEPAKSLLLWLSLSLLLGPFAPPSLTGGDPRVGRGPVVDFPADDDPSPAPATERRSKPHRRSEQSPIEASPPSSVAMAETLATTGREREEVKEEAWEEREWTEGEIEVLKKQLVKNPPGKPRRWEAIAEKFRGRHGVESVIRKAKELGEKKLSDGDSYSEFLRKRKQVDKRLADQESESGSKDDNGGGAEAAWSSGEDIALLNALKAFPKEAPLRWEKVAAAVPGKSKAACVKRTAELKKGFRSSKKAAAES